MISALQHNNPRTVAPPGLLPQSNGRNVLIASLTRSGTHVLIDLLLNNFASLRNQPLYVDLDMWLRKGHSLDSLSQLEGVIFKTHYPQDELPVSEEEFEAFLQKANPIVLATERDLDSVYKSATSASFPRYTNREEFDRDAQRHTTFWKEKAEMTLPLSELLQPQSYSLLAGKLEGLLEQPVRKTLIYPRSKDQKKRVLLDKLLTRLLGRRAAVINTTVGFAKK